MKIHFYPKNLRVHKYIKQTNLSFPLNLELLQFLGSRKKCQGCNKIFKLNVDKKIWEREVTQEEEKKEEKVEISEFCNKIKSHRYQDGDKLTECHIRKYTLEEWLLSNLANKKYVFVKLKK